MANLQVFMKYQTYIHSYSSKEMYIRKKYYQKRFDSDGRFASKYDIATIELLQNVLDVRKVIKENNSLVDTLQNNLDLNISNRNKQRDDYRKEVIDSLEHDKEQKSRSYLKQMLISDYNFNKDLGR